MNNYPNDIWKLFKQNTEYVPEDIKIDFDLSGKKFQLFEVVFTKLISLVNSSASWKVTPVQGDKGVDFYGDQNLFELNEIGIRGSVKIGGQCKRRNISENPIDAFSGDIVKMINSINPIYIIIGFASSTPKKELKESQEILSRQFNRPVYLFGIEDIDYLLRTHLDEVKLIIKKSLPSKDFVKIINHFKTPTKNVTPRIDFEITQKGERSTGSINSLLINIKSAILFKSNLNIKWIRPQFDNRENIILIKPNLLAHDNGLEIQTGNSFSVSLDFKFISYIAGIQDMGKLQLIIDEEHTTLLELGNIKIIDNYHPRFYWPPFEKERQIFKELYEKVSNGSVELITITGEGGIGKSRLAYELGIYGEQDGAEFISISQVHNYEKPYQVFGDLLLELTFNKIYENSSYFDIVNDCLKQLNQELAKKVEDTLKLIYDQNSSTNKILVFNKEYLIQSFILLSLYKLKGNSLIIHFSDLHWCHHSVLTTLSEFITKLRKIQLTKKISILFIFEGRAGEHSKLGNKLITYNDYSTNDFERFIRNNRKLNIHIKPLNKNKSEGFLENLFENSQSNFRKVKSHLIPHQSKLIKEILKYGSGNPFHLIEQLKLLIHKGIVHRNERTGLLFLFRELPSKYEVPKEIELLILNRYSYIKENTPEVANLIRSVALVQDRIPYQLFEYLLITFTGTEDIKLVSETNILILPQNKYSEVKFRHENYYNVLKKTSFDSNVKETAIERYLYWIEHEDQNSSETIFLKTRILSKSYKPDHNLITKLLKVSWSKANNQYQDELEQRIIYHLLHHIQQSTLFSKLSFFDQTIEKSNWKQKLAQLYIQVGDWAMASKQLEETYKSIDIVSKQSSFKFDQIQDISYVKYSLIVSLANTYINQLKTHKAIKLLTSNLEEIKLSFGLNKTHTLIVKKWLTLYLNGINRLGVAFWHDGNYKESLNKLKTGLEIIPSSKDFIIIKHIYLLDIGAVTLHFDIDTAIKEMQKGLDLLVGLEASPRYRLLGETTKLMGVVMKNVKDGLNTTVSENIIATLEQIFIETRRRKFHQEESASGLLIAIIYALNSDQKCIKWFMEVIDICYNNNLLETLWKAHLNLAQFEFGNQSDDNEAAILHAKFAEDSLNQDLNQRTIEEKKYRLSHYRLPVIQLQKILGTTNLKKHYKNDLFDYSLNDFDSDYREDILYLNNDQSIYFLYGG